MVGPMSGHPAGRVRAGYRCMLRILRQSQRWIMAVVVVIVGGVFVFFIGGGGRIRNTPIDVLIDVDGQQFGPSEFERVRQLVEGNLRKSVGEGIDPKMLAQVSEQQTTSFLVHQALLAREATRIGVQVSEQEMREAVKQSGLGRDEQGGFSVKSYRDEVQYSFGSERLFLDVLRRDLLAQKMRETLAASAGVSQAEARDAVMQRREQVKIAWVALDTTKLRGDTPEPTDAQVDDLLAKDDARVKRFFDEHADRYRTPEQVHARHFLVRVPRDATPEQTAEAEKKARAGLERAKQGEDFASIAKELSDDPGSKDRGGDLGFFRRGAMVPPFEEAAFGLEPGATSDLVKTDFGFHVIRVEEKKPAEEHAFDEVKRAIAREVVTTDLAAAQARSLADALAEAVKGGASLQDAARKEALVLERTDWLQHRPDGFVAGLGGSPELLDTAFALPEAGQSSPRVFEVDDRLVLIQLLERQRPSDDEVTREIPAERDRLLQDERQRVEQAWVDAERKKLEAAGRLVVNSDAISGRVAPRS